MRKMKVVGRDELVQASEMLAYYEDQYKRYYKVIDIARYPDKIPPFEPGPYIPGPIPYVFGSMPIKEITMPAPKRKKPDHEVELVKNIIADVLTKKLDCKRHVSQDAYRLEFGADIPRALVVQGSLYPIKECLLSIKDGLCKVIDDAIKEMEERNQGY